MIELIIIAGMIVLLVISLRDPAKSAKRAAKVQTDSIIRAYKLNKPHV